MFYSLAVLTFGTAVPAGQFVPGIMIGSTYGRLVGMFVVNFYKKLNIEEGTWVFCLFLPSVLLFVSLIMDLSNLSFMACPNKVLPSAILLVTEPLE